MHSTLSNFSTLAQTLPATIHSLDIGLCQLTTLVNAKQQLMVENG